MSTIILNPADHPDPPPGWLAMALGRLAEIPAGRTRPGARECAAGLLSALELDPFPMAIIRATPGGAINVTFSGPTGAELTLSFQGIDARGGPTVEYLFWRPFQSSIISTLFPDRIEHARHLARQVYPLQEADLLRDLEWMPEGCP